ncbi:MAG TPA: ribulose-phosphate 3-epimerase [Desulfosalsimonadaceae bacterium]|nr:ribulose-phosphate 3-epimerase [Desulfosalsimonadaceae bacterium]
MNKLIAPSILSADFGRLAEEIRSVESAGADWIHVDVMDGHFVPNITMGPMVVAAARQACSLPLDVHLMIENPDQFIPEFAKAGADLISVHGETCPHLHRSIELIRTAGCRAGAVLNPATPVETLEWILPYLDFVLLMSVNPGFGGQSFIAETLEKIRRVKSMIEAGGYGISIEIDGGVNKDTIGDIASAGADIFVAGSAIFKTADYARTIQELRDLAGEKP